MERMEHQLPGKNAAYTHLCAAISDRDPPNDRQLPVC